MLSDLKKALEAHPQAYAEWKSLTPIAQRDFISWIESAKQTETRKRRIAIACDKLKSGKRRPCCYAVIPLYVYSALKNSPKAKAQWSTLSPNERRDIVTWIDSAQEKKERELRAIHACKILATGKRSV